MANRTVAKKPAAKKAAKKSPAKKAASTKAPTGKAAGKAAMSDEKRWGTRSDLGADPTGYLNDLPADLGAIARRLHKRLTKGQDVSCMIKWGMPVYSIGKTMIASQWKGKGYVRLGLYTGAGLPDPAGLFEGEGKGHRHVKLFPDKMPAWKDVETLVDASLAAARSDHTG